MLLAGSLQFRITEFRLHDILISFDFYLSRRAAGLNKLVFSDLFHFHHFIVFFPDFCADVGACRASIFLGGGIRLLLLCCAALMKASP